MPDEGELQRAIQLLRTGQKNEAREVLKGVLLKDRENPLAWATLAQATNSHQEALFCLKQVLRLKPGDPWAMQRLQLLEAMEAAGGQPAQPAPQSTSPTIKALRPVPVRDPIAHARDQQLRAESQTAPAPGESTRAAQPVLPDASFSQPSAASSVRADSLASRLSAGIKVAVLLGIGIIILAAGLTVWDEFVARYPGDEQKVVQAASDWTTALYHADYETLSNLVCGKYASDVNEMRRAGVVTGIFAQTMGAPLGSEPPRNLQYELVYLQGGHARVHVTGLAGEFEYVKPPAFMNERTYLMRREWGSWRWCGEQFAE